MNYQPKYNTVQAKYPHTRPPGTNGVHAIPEYYTEQGIIDHTSSMVPTWQRC